MRLQALRNKAGGKQQIAEPKTLPAPIKGWYVGAPLAEPPPGTAYVLDNAFPQLDYVRARAGCVAYATAIPGATTVAALMPWTDGINPKMFAASNGAIYDVSGSGAVGAALVSGLTNSNFQFIQFSGTGGQFLMAANGYDPVQLFNGTAWGTTPAITGLTGNPLSALWTFKHRVYGIERATLNAWYLPIDSIGGIATVFPMEALFAKGGYLVAGGTWALPTVNGLLEACIFITSEGEVAVFTGPYPGDTNWGQQGVYKVSKPLGSNCLMKAGGDMAIMTEDGIVPMSKVETLDQVALQNSAITLPIAPAWRDAVLARTGIAGWQIVLWPLQSMAIINLPKANAIDRTQFIANARTGAWCRYLGWDANCFAVFNNNLYFGTSDGRVMQGEAGGQDDGGIYTTTIFYSFTDLDAGPVRKIIHQVRARIRTNFAVQPVISVNVDYDISIPPAPGSLVLGQPSTQWGIAKWGLDKWPASIFQLQNWVGVPAEGSVVAPIVQMSFSGTSAPDMRLTSMDILYETGNEIG
jgi:hypothetical protein